MSCGMTSRLTGQYLLLSGNTAMRYSEIGPAGLSRRVGGFISRNYRPDLMLCVLSILWKIPLPPARANWPSCCVVRACCTDSMRKIIIFLFKLPVILYRKLLSPLFPPTCRFYPTCSAYTLEALDRYGPLKGLYLSLKRILKCNPYHPGGYDPLP